MELLITYIVRQLRAVYEPGEARAVARRLLEEGFGWPPLRVFAGTEADLQPDERRRLQHMLDRLSGGEPLQYVLGFEWFDGRRLEVGPGVLIPRPETQDLVEWVAADAATGAGVNRVLDACTGSGCIALSLAARFPQATVQALDVSEEALAYARRNVQACGVRVELLHQPLQEYRGTEMLDILVSNPPYIADSERAGMEERVKAWEPGLALFVSDGDPLYFYRLLAETGMRELRPCGALYVEINSRFGCEVCRLFSGAGYREVELREDRFGLPRMVKGIK